MVVKVPVANVRAKPVRHNGEYVYDPLQETQVEKGERILVYKREGSWALVECPDQQEFSHKSKWEGYPGWVEWKILTSDVSKATVIEKSNTSEDALRQRILGFAKKHVGHPYLWGGRSLHDSSNKKVVTGVDCSGLINWSFRQVGWLVPRDAHEQHMQSQSLEPADLKPGDLVFLAKADNPGKIVHVMFYEGDGRLLEAPQSGERVRVISFQDRFGVALDEAKSGLQIADRILYFGSFFKREK